MKLKRFNEDKIFDNIDENKRNDQIEYIKKHTKLKIDARKMKKMTDKEIEKFYKKVKENPLNERFNDFDQPDEESTSSKNRKFQYDLESKIDTAIKPDDDDNVNFEVVYGLFEDYYEGVEDGRIEYVGSEEDFKKIGDRLDEAFDKYEEAFQILVDLKEKLWR